jgi:crotonobetainyl-CoA:carnitine CoA-transferase CaiB-like acyl-CoA transferase
MSVTGDVAGCPARLGVPIADLAAGLFAVQGILAALLDRTSSGRGRYVDIAMCDAAAALLPYHAAAALTTGESLPRMGNGHSSIVPYDTFQASDGLLMLAVGNDDQWRRFCAAAERPGLAADDRYATNAQRVSQRDQLVALVADVIVTRAREDWLSRLRQAGVPCGLVRTVEEAMADPQIDARDMVAGVQHPTAGTLSLVASPVKLSDSTARPDRPPPLLGQHTDAILTEDLGVTAEALAELRRRKIV